MATPYNQAAATQNLRLLTVPGGWYQAVVAIPKANNERRDPQPHLQARYRRRAL